MDNKIFNQKHKKKNKKNRGEKNYLLCILEKRGKALPFFTFVVGLLFSCSIRGL